MVDMTNY